MRWLLHIGAPKTGSTAIQRMLFDNRAELLSRGVLYPDASLRGFGHHDLAFLLGGGYPHWATPQPRPLSDLAQDLRAEVAAHRAATVVVSSENFFLYPDPAALRDLLQFAGLTSNDHVEVLCYVRRQDEAYSSWYNQTVKAQGNPASFEATMAATTDLFDYLHRLEPWSRVFGASAFRIRDYAPFSGGGVDIRVDVLEWLGLSPEGLSLPGGRSNERINRDIVGVQRLINRLPLPAQAKRRYHRELIALTADADGQGVFDDRPYLSPADAKALVGRYDDGNTAVARAFLGRDALFDPFEPATTAPASARPGVRLSKIAYAARWMAARRRAR